MTVLYNRVGAGLVLLSLLGSATATAQTLDPLDPLVEYRYRGAPIRNADGVIVRRTAVTRAFRRIHRCPNPSALPFTGACPGWSMNHVIPLACGGADAVWNLMWMRNDVKAIVDLYERKISASTPPQPDTALCVNVIVP